MIKTTLKIIGTLAAMALAVPVLLIGIAALFLKPLPHAQATAVIPLVAAPMPVPVLKPASKFSMQDRARWACSDAIKSRAVLPDELRWTRRSQWLVVERDPGVWEVHAQFVGRNRMGVDIPDARACTLRYKNDNFYLIKG